MSTTPAKPCAPPLNLVANGGPGSPFPAPLDETQLPTQDSNPGFGDLVTQILGDSGDATDGFDVAVQGAAALIDQADAALADADTTLDGILLQLAAVDTMAVDNSFTNYLNTFDAGDAIVGSAQGLTVTDPTTGAPAWLSAGPPQPAPVNGGGGGGGSTPPTTGPGPTVSPKTFSRADFPGQSLTQVITLFSYRAGDPAFEHQESEGNATHTPYAIGSVTIEAGDRSVFTATKIYAQQFAGTYTGDLLGLGVNPHQAGTFTAVVRGTFAPAGMTDDVVGFGIVVRST